MTHDTFKTRKPEWLRLGKLWVTKHLGKPCKGFCHGCVVCEAHLAIHRLEVMLGEKKDR